MKNKNILISFGTRPEAIKMCPVIKEIEKNRYMNCTVCVTGQHKDMLDQVLNKFHVKPQYNLNIMKNEQTLTSITIEILRKIEHIFEKEKPDIVLVQGDTTSALAIALAAFYQKIPVGHIEAGLRTYNRYNPFPEEMNRCLIAKLSTLHFSPTKNNEKNLELENIKDNVFITGNTVIDAFRYTVNKKEIFSSIQLKKIDFKDKKTILFTMHRRENVGQPIKNICDVIKKLIKNYSDIQFIYPVHPNPVIRNNVNGYFENVERIYLTDPLDVEDMHNVIARSYLVMTDSGGLQEEAPHFGIPVVVLRNETERIEAIEAGTAILGGIESQKIYQIVSRLLLDKNYYNTMACSVNPYGDGHASEKIVHILEQWFEKEKGNV